MLKNLKNKEEGFTIIEVLIVLAIAALIFLIVFLAVPALQRNTRNNGRKNDASRIATGVANFVSNNNGSAPTITATSLNDCKTIMQDIGNLNQYSDVSNTNNGCGTGANTTSIVSGATNTNSGFYAPQSNEVIVDEGAVCSGALATTTGANARQIAVNYTLETSNGWQWACVTAD